MMMNKVILFLFLVCAISCSSAASGAELMLSPGEKSEDGVIIVDFRVSGAPNLAGIKLVIEYDERLYHYQTLEKSVDTSAMMHVVNDKTPGRLIVVMASATGQAEADFDLFTIRFAVQAQAPLPGFTITVKEVEMMGADLKEIPCPARTYQLN